MLVYGYAIEYMYTGDGTLLIRTRIPSIHGPMNKSEYKGQQIKKYTEDDALPWYPSLLLPYLPNRGEVVLLSSTSDALSSSFIVLGLTGGSSINPATDQRR